MQPSTINARIRALSIQLGQERAKLAFGAGRVNVQGMGKHPTLRSNLSGEPRR